MVISWSLDIYFFFFPLAPWIHCFSILPIWLKIDSLILVFTLALWTYPFLFSANTAPLDILFLYFADTAPWTHSFIFFMA